MDSFARPAPEVSWPAAGAPLSTLLSWDGGLTLAAPLVAIVVALATRRVVPSLVLAVLVGGVVAENGALLDGLITSLRTAWSMVTDTTNLTISSFSVLVAATVGVMGASGGTGALVGRIERLASGRRGAMTATAAAGSVVFFDDYANCIVVGGAMGPLCDRNRVSRAKLAYIVDATAAPLASLAIVSTWVGYEVGLFENALAELSSPVAAVGAFPLFLQAIPYRFYCWLTLAFVFAIAWTGRDFGPMRAVEANPPPPPVADGSAGGLHTGTEGITGSGGPWHAAVPVLALVGVTFGTLLWQGAAAVDDPANARLFEIIGAADPFQSMLIGSIVAWCLASGLAIATGALGSRAVVEASWGTVRTMLSALVVLYLAWTLSGLIKAADADDYIAGALDGRLSASLLPAAVFLAGALTSFSTGSSYLAMGTLIPVVLPIAAQLDPGSGLILVASAAAVLDGSVLGDHASPISDTTVLSSLGAGADVLTHVRTQLPYALTVGVVAVLLGSIPVGMGAPPWLVLPVGAAVCVAIVRVVGQPPPAA